MRRLTVVGVALTVVAFVSAATTTALFGFWHQICPVQPCNGVTNCSYTYPCQEYALGFLIAAVVFGGAAAFVLTISRMWHEAAAAKRSTS